MTPATAELEKTPTAIEGLNENLQDFARLAIEALAGRYGLKPTDFDVFKIEGQNPEEEELLSIADLRRDGTPWIPKASTVPVRHVIQFSGNKDAIKAQKKANKDFKKPGGSISVGKHNWQMPVRKSRSLAADSKGKKVPTVDMPLDI